MAEYNLVAALTSSSLESDVDFDYRVCVKMMQCKSLEPNYFRAYWAKHVPAIFSPQLECDCLNISYDEDLAREVLFLPLEQFVCNTSEPSKFFEHMKTVGSIPSLCGRVFKAGEPTYSCRDCGLDPTCVVCVDCFTKSAHRFHRYKMSTSGGGGYCDCGDEEAWKSDCFCEIHHKGKSEVTSSSNPLDKLPTDIIDRLKFVMRLVLQYSYQMLTWIHAVDLPHDLQTISQVCENYELPDTYCTVLFNDETHTYEQVIETLSKAISCSKKAAIDFATTIDREGRSIVKCSKYATCNHARHIIERITTRHVANSLKVMVMHTDVVSHQTFSMRLLTWLQKLLGIHEGFRLVFSQVMMEPMDHDTCTLLENIMVSDTQLWKSARNQYHQLFISGMLMDQHCKKVFAKVFARNYPILIKDFMADDHDHSISVTSLSVQIFTVPTLAHALIEEDDVITILLRAFLTECERNKNEDGKLAFQRNQMTSTFRRAHYILYDLKYLVTVIPSKWSDELQIHFLYGLQSYLNLLNFMQGMDSVVRQVGHHIEYEAEWETGINLQLRVATISTLLVQWCGSDFWVFVKAFRTTLRMLSISSSPHSRPFCIPIEIANHSTNCIEYDVSAMPVTIHLPLSRFAAGLFLHLEKFDLYYDSSQFQMENTEKPSPEYLMEFPLRTLVMLAQFRAGMWRRNGYSLLNQIYFYHNVRFRDEMFDRDIVMLQIAASLIESNEFLIHLVYKFGLINWADPKYDGVIKKSEDDNIRQVLTVAEEFLSLLLTIVSERFTPGIGKVSESDRIKKEIIQLLCIEPMPHSLIYKMLPKDPNNETGMEDVVSEVASFKKPQGPGTGKYELKEEFLKCFNPFYYHYTKEEQSKAEETQLKRKKQMGHELCCPPPVPPEFTPRFSIITNILQCDVMLHILHMIFSRTLNLHCAVFSEAQFEKVLHIVGVALHEEEHAFAGERENSFFNFTSRAVGQGIPPLMEECLKSARVESQKDLLRWVLAKFKSVESLRAHKSGENSCVNASSAEEGESLAQNRKHRAELAAARKARIMAQMTNLQLNFMKEHADLFREAVLEDSVNVSQTQLDSMELGTDDPVSIGCKQKGKVICQKIHTCILCREDQEVSCSGRALVLAAFVQRSSVLSKVRKSNKNSVIKEPHDYDPLQFSSDLSCAPHVSTCGHVMHSDCWQKFFESVLRKEQRRPLRFGRHTSFEVDKNEYLCPLCERLSNTVIPIIPQLTLLGPEKDFNVSISIDDWLSAMKKVVEEFQFEKMNDPPLDDNKAKYLTHHYLPLRLSEVIEELPETIRHQFLAMFSSLQTCLYANPEFSEHLLEMMKLFSQTTYTVGLQCDPNLTDSRVPAMSWWSCAYTIHAIEWLLREQKKPLFGKLSSRTALCLEAMVRFSGASLRVFDHNVVRTQSVRLLRYLLLGEHYLSSPQCALDLDAFAVLIFLVLSMPVLFQCDDQKKCEPVLCPLGSVLDAYLMHLMYIFHLVQLLLSYPFNDENAMQIDEVNEVFEVNEEVVAMHFYQDIRTASGLDQSMPTPSGRAIVSCIKSGSMPFLRCAALFFHVLTDTAPPANLEEISDMEFEHTCKYLGLPTSMNELLMSPSLKQLALSWARHPRTLHLLQRTSELTEASEDSEQAVGCLVHHPMSVNHIVQLPNDYSELINSASLFTCPNSDGDDSRNPTMCLVCGTVLCSQSYCCQIDLDGTMVGACTHHAHYCGCGIGIFLRIRDCKILLLSDKNKGCFMPPPYVDDYGETDQGLFRGNPLHLCREKYEELNELWLSHNIPEQVSHMMEQSTTLPNWQLL